MEIGMIGLGRMGANMVRRLLRGGHRVLAHDRSADAIAEVVREGAIGKTALADLTAGLSTPRVLWLMVPAGVVDHVLDDLIPHLAPGDIVVDGGNSNFQDDLVRAARLAETGLHFVDCGTSGGVWGLERGYCLMIGGAREVFARLEPLCSTLSPEHGYLHCGGSGAGHFVKMVHNAIEYGMMAAYAEGFNLLRHANIGAQGHAVDAETTPLRHPEHYRYVFDMAAIAELWRHGSVITSWLLDLTAQALKADPNLSSFSGRVSDSGEGRWTLAAANDLAVPVPVLGSALFARFASRGEADYQNQLLSALRQQFGGHVERPRHE